MFPPVVGRLLHARDQVGLEVVCECMQTCDPEHRNRLLRREFADDVAFIVHFLHNRHNHELVRAKLTHFAPSSPGSLIKRYPPSTFSVAPSSTPPVTSMKRCSRSNSPSLYSSVSTSATSSALIKPAATKALAFGKM